MPLFSTTSWQLKTASERMSFELTASSGGACTTDNCAAEYPGTCPVTSAGEAGVNEASFGSAPASGNTPAPPVDAAGTSTTTTVALQSVTPTACSQNANYDCAAGYIITATGTTATLVSTTNGNCDQGTATISGTSASGTFPSNNIAFSASAASDNQVTVAVGDGSGGTCTGTYKVTSGGPFLGISAQSQSVQSSKKGCFPGHATVQVRNGGIKTKYIRDLSVGEQVMTLTTAGNLEFQEVFMFTHKSPEMAQHLTIQTDNGQTISLTPDHYILVSNSAVGIASIGASKVLPAADVKVGDKLITINGAKLEWGIVQSISHGFEEGLYNPHTSAGTILVNNVAALTFPSSLPPYIAAHTVATFPAKVLYNLIPHKDLAAVINEGLLSGYFQLASVFDKLQAFVPLTISLAS
ncbi:hypothetical protein WJX84_004571 [Apatococcus fuscideae]|uniref:Hint domain-containing protein n=1 Tax=Apatococcus fuscideae TaxID=2026836 RepID=A0AAW1TGL4_9CHLO